MAKRYGAPSEASDTKRVTACYQTGQATWCARPNIYVCLSFGNAWQTVSTSLYFGAECFWTSRRHFYMFVEGMGLVRDFVLYKMHGTAVDFAEFAAPLYTCLLDQPGGRRGGPRLGINHYSVIKS